MTYEKEKSKSYICGDDLITVWKLRHFPPVPRDSEWEKLKWHFCKAGEPKNPICNCRGDEIYVEQFGIIGWIYRSDKFYHCPLIEARETGTGKFDEWLKNVKEFVRQEFKTEFALSNITNEKLYKYCLNQKIPVAVNGNLYSVNIQ